MNLNATKRVVGIIGQEVGLRIIEEDPDQEKEISGQDLDLMIGQRKSVGIIVDHFLETDYLDHVLEKDHMKDLAGRKEKSETEVGRGVGREIGVGIEVEKAQNLLTWKKSMETVKNLGQEVHIEERRVHVEDMTQLNQYLLLRKKIYIQQVRL